MKIYKLSVLKVYEPTGTIISSHLSSRTEEKAEYFKDKMKAQFRESDMIAALINVFGSTQNTEFRITEIDVVE